MRNHSQHMALAMDCRMHARCQPEEIHMKATNLAELIIGSAIVAGKDMGAAGVLAPHHFIDPKLALLWKAQAELRKAGDRVSPLALRNKCDALRMERGGPAVSLSDMAGWSSTNTGDDGIREAAKTIVRGYRSRKITDICNEAAKEAAQDGADPDKIINTILKFAHEDRGDTDQLLSNDDIMTAVAEDWKRRAAAAASGQAAVIPTGITALDEALGGGYEFGAVYVLGARPKMGKTAYSMTSGVAAAEEGFPVLVVSLEMSAVQTGRRLLALKSDRVSVSDLKLPRFEEAVQEVMRVYDNKIRKLPIHYRLKASSSGEIVSTARQWWRMHGKRGLIIIDYLQLMSGEDLRSREREIAEMSRAMKLLALELDCAVLMLSQLNRKVEERDPPKPRMSDLRESGAIEQDADAIILLYRPAVYNRPDGTPYHKDDRHVEVILAASREGTPRMIPAVFNGAHTRFENRPEGTK